MLFPGDPMGQSHAKCAADIIPGILTPDPMAEPGITHIFQNTSRTQMIDLTETTWLTRAQTGTHTQGASLQSLCLWLQRALQQHCLESHPNVSLFKWTCPGHEM